MFLTRTPEMPECCLRTELSGFQESIMFNEFKLQIGPNLIREFRKLTRWGYSGKVGLIYVVSPRFSLYSDGLSDPRDILIRFSLYQWTYGIAAASICRDGLNDDV